MSIPTFKQGDKVHFTRKVDGNYVYKVGTFQKYEMLGGTIKVLIVIDDDLNKTPGLHYTRTVVYPSEVNKNIRKHKRRKFNI